MESQSQLEYLKREQRAFDEQLTPLLEDHAGKFVVFKGEKPAAFFESYQAAYDWAIERFSLSEVFLVSEVKRRSDESTSISWQAGVLVADV